MKALEEFKGVVSIPASERYQFKIMLLESQPLIWRRIQVKNRTLDKLHEHIQTAMGWTNSHLRQFENDGERYGNPELLDDGFECFHCLYSRVSLRVMPARRNSRPVAGPVGSNAITGVSQTVRRRPEDP